MMHLRFLVPTPICPPCLVFRNRCERVCEEEEKERCGGIYIFIPVQLPRTAHHACDSFYESHNIAGIQNMIWWIRRHGNIVTEIRNTVPCQSCFTCTYQSSLRVFGNARVYH
jgi:hypothetical protein